MGARLVWTYFYGSNINLEILKRFDYVPERVEVARLPGFDITIRPLANLVPSEGRCVYGILATGTHDDLERLYGRYVHLCQTLDERWVPALCYIAAPTDPAPATDEYLGRILKPARDFGFPDWYLERLESFRA
jgi:hypothetical protein